jgi:hypothetical protein
MSPVISLAERTRAGLRFLRFGFSAFERRLTGLSARCPRVTANPRIGSSTRNTPSTVLGESGCSSRCRTRPPTKTLRSSSVYCSSWRPRSSVGGLGSFGSGSAAERVGRGFFGGPTGTLISCDPPKRRRRNQPSPRRTGYAYRSGRRQRSDAVGQATGPDVVRAGFPLHPVISCALPLAARTLSLDAWGARQGTPRTLSERPRLIVLDLLETYARERDIDVRLERHHDRH